MVAQNIHESKIRDHKWVENQLAGIEKRLEEELELYGGDDQRNTRHQIHLDLAVVRSALDEYRATRVHE